MSGKLPPYYSESGPPFVSSTLDGRRIVTFTDPLMKIIATSKAISETLLERRDVDAAITKIGESLRHHRDLLEFLKANPRL